MVAQFMAAIPTTTLRLPERSQERHRDDITPAPDPVPGLLGGRLRSTPARLPFSSTTTIREALA